MTSNFESVEPGLSLGNSSLEQISWDKVEMLSAYIDEELPPAERNQVQSWLDHDPKIKQVYVQMMALQGQIRHSAVPPVDQSIEEITAKVFQSIDHHRRWRRNLTLNLTLGGGAIAAFLLAAVLGVIPGMNPVLKTANSQQNTVTSTIPNQTLNPTVTLAVALNKPAINIPKSAVHNSFKPNQKKSQTADF